MKRTKTEAHKAEMAARAERRARRSAMTAGRVVTPPKTAVLDSDEKLRRRKRRLAEVAAGGWA